MTQQQPIQIQFTPTKEYKPQSLETKAIPDFLQAWERMLLPPAHPVDLVLQIGVSICTPAFLTSWAIAASCPAWLVFSVLLFTFVMISMAVYVSSQAKILPLFMCRLACLGTGCLLGVL